MNIFAYFQEEQQDIETKLRDLTENYGTLSREEVFDKVKYIGDAVTGHLKKQESLILSHIEKTAAVQPLLEECQKDRARVEEELGQLVMVHVDEPNYADCLQKLLNVVDEHIRFSAKLYEKLKGILSDKQLVEMDNELNVMIHHASDFNALQP